MYNICSMFKNLNFFRNRVISISTLVWGWKKRGGHGIYSDYRLIDDICKVLHTEGEKINVD